FPNPGVYRIFNGDFTTRLRDVVIYFLTNEFRIFSIEVLNFNILSIINFKFTASCTMELVPFQILRSHGKIAVLENLYNLHIFYLISIVACKLVCTFRLLSINNTAEKKYCK